MFMFIHQIEFSFSGHRLARCHTPSSLLHIHILISFPPSCVPPVSLSKHPMSCPFVFSSQNILAFNSQLFSSLSLFLSFWSFCLEKSREYQTINKFDRECCFFSKKANILFISFWSSPRCYLLLVSIFFFLSLSYSITFVFAFSVDKLIFFIFQVFTRADLSTITQLTCVLCLSLCLSVCLSVHRLSMSSFLNNLVTLTCLLLVFVEASEDTQTQAHKLSCLYQLLSINRTS